MRLAAAITPADTSRAFAALAPLFRYPDASYDCRIGEAQRHASLDPFVAATGSLDLAARQAAYTATFDLTPACSPYLGVHLFGEENPDRARLMIGLRQTYLRAGMNPDRNELPDHVADVLELASSDCEERDDLIRLVLMPATTKMNEILSPTANPYRHLVAAALAACAEAIAPGGSS